MSRSNHWRARGTYWTFCSVRTYADALGVCSRDTARGVHEHVARFVPCASHPKRLLNGLCECCFAGRQYHFGLHGQQQAMTFEGHAMRVSLTLSVQHVVAMQILEFILSWHMLDKACSCWRPRVLGAVHACCHEGARHCVCQLF